MDVRSAQPAPIIWRDYLELCKPRVVALMLLTVVVGMYLATPGWVSLPLLAWYWFMCGECCRDKSFG